jgi:hypothetical protein
MLVTEGICPGKSFVDNLSAVCRKVGFCEQFENVRQVMNGLSTRYEQHFHTFFSICVETLAARLYPFGQFISQVSGRVQHN